MIITWSQKKWEDNKVDAKFKILLLRKKRSLMMIYSPSSKISSIWSVTGLDFSVMSRVAPSTASLYGWKADGQFISFPFTSSSLWLHLTSRFTYVLWCLLMCLSHTALLMNESNKSVFITAGAVAVVASLLFLSTRRIGRKKIAIPIKGGAIIISGASTGIGRAAAESLAGKR